MPNVAQLSFRFFPRSGVLGATIAEDFELLVNIPDQGAQSSAFGGCRNRSRSLQAIKQCDRGRSSVNAEFASPESAHEGFRRGWNWDGQPPFQLSVTPVRPMDTYWKPLRRHHHMRKVHGGSRPGALGLAKKVAQSLMNMRRLPQFRHVQQASTEDSDNDSDVTMGRYRQKNFGK